MTARVLALALLAAAPTARANMATPATPGTPAGEPAAALDGLRIARETLALDLRPLGRGRPFGVVEAEYRIVNTGGARVVPLEFVALGQDVDAAEVWLDGRPVAAQRVDALAVPPSWRVADRTPALDGDAVPYEADDGVGAARGLRFAVTVPPGQHVVRVRYRVRLGTYDDGGHPNRVWQLAYSLAPARLWGGFGQLDVTVRAPDGWDLAASLPLRREGDALVGRFRGVPGDVLAVSARAPAPALRVPLRVAGVVAGLIVAVFFGFVSGRLAARAGKSAWRALPGSVLGGIVGGVAFAAIVMTADDLGDSIAYGYRTLLGMMLVAGPLAVLVGSALAQAVAVWRVRVERPDGEAGRGVPSPPGRGTG
ncbi:hypothetical protein [Rubrivirga sp.]|uniref:hypothetical protein n=1 Tax=Rubrivirga sp. TaxID=1885344 RepID=UPI003B5212B2